MHPRLRDFIMFGLRCTAWDDSAWGKRSRDSGLTSEADIDRLPIFIATRRIPYVQVRTRRCSSQNPSSGGQSFSMVSATVVPYPRWPVGLPAARIRAFFRPLSNSTPGICPILIKKMVFPLDTASVTLATYSTVLAMAPCGSLRRSVQIPR